LVLKGVFLERIHIKYLDSWLLKKSRKPLIIRGARQVGKSTLVRNFSKVRKLNLYEINLEKNIELNELFKKNNPAIIIEAIEDLLSKKMSFDRNQKNLLFLDEIQETPAAISCLRYFYEEYPTLAVICAGSLLEFTLNDYEYSMPVGRIEFMHIGPMTFYEFLKARGENYTLEKLKSLTDLKQISEVFHEKCVVLLKEYFFIGGMPEAIKTSIESGLETVPQIHSQILETYQNDFIKYSKKNHLGKIQKVFRHLYLNPCSKIIYSKISSDDNSRDLKFNLELLFKAKVATPVFHTNCSGIPLETTKSENVFKSLLLDVGLMNYFQKSTWISIKNMSTEKILTDGKIAEQFVGQQLLTLQPSYESPSLYYWLREGKSSNAEVDYIIERSPFLIAIEVKAGASGKIRSLHQWVKDTSHKKKKCVRFNLSRGGEELVKHQYEDHLLEYSLLTIPLYLIESLDQLVGPT
jgi:predicted AAA+ superfamily ATPase